MSIKFIKAKKLLLFTLFLSSKLIISSNIFSAAAIAYEEIVAKQETIQKEIAYLSQKQKNLLLHEKVETGDIKILDMLIKAGANINYLNRENDLTPLMSAARENNIKVLKFLLESKANPNIESMNDRQTALMFAAYNCNISIINLLIEAKAVINSKTRYCYTPLMLSIDSNNTNQEVVNLLLKSGSELDILNNNKQTALDIAKERERCALVNRSLHTKIVSLLTNESLIRTKIVNKRNEAIILFASKTFNKDLTKIILAYCGEKFFDIPEAERQLTNNGSAICIIS